MRRRLLTFGPAPFSAPSGLVGLALSYALSVTSLLSGLIFSFTQTEMQLVSVERTEEYSTALPAEPQHPDPQVSGVATATGPREPATGF